MWDNAGEDNVLFLAGGIAFNILLAVVPFILLLIWFLTYLLNRSSANSTEIVFRYVDRLLPQSDLGNSPYHSLLADVLGSHNELPIFSFIGFVWFSTRLFGSLRTVLASVFDIESERSIIDGKIFDIKMTFLATVLITANTLISGYVLLATNRSVTLLTELGIRGDVMGAAKAWGGRIVATALLTTMFFALYKFLPIRRQRTKTAWMAAFFTTAAFELAKLVFTYYVGTFNPSSLYTSTVAALVVVVVWVYYAALIFILGGEFGQVYELRRTRKRQRETLLD